MSNYRPYLVWITCLGLLLVSPARAQDVGRWSGLFGGSNGIDGLIYAIATDDSGRVYVGGSFISAGGVASNNMALWTGSEWEPLGDGFDDSVFEIAIDDSGFVYAGGLFVRSGTVEVNGLARWDGETWNPMGTGLAKERDTGSSLPSVWAIAFSAEGTMYIGGDFTEVDGVSAVGIAQWDGETWAAVGDRIERQLCVDIPRDDVYAVAVDDSGHVYMGGNFVGIGDVPAIGIARWDGNAWTALGNAIIDDERCGTISSIAVYRGEIYAAGGPLQIGRINPHGIAKWTGTSWEALDGGVEGAINTMSVGETGIYVGGRFTRAGTETAINIAKWTLSGWEALNGGVDRAFSIDAVSANGRSIYVGGNRVTGAVGVESFGIALWEVISSVDVDRLPNPDSGGLLFDAYPNPVFNEVNFRYANSAASGSQVRISIYNVLGQLVAELEDVATPGSEVIRWNMTELPAGVYIARVNSVTEYKALLLYKIPD